MNSVEELLRQRVLRYVVFTGCVILFVFLVATIWEGKAAGWGKWIYEYQTLIAGTAAVVAASLTVHQMKKSDALQENRHKQLLFSALRGEQVTAERIYDFFKQNFLYVEIYLQQHFALRANTPEEWTHKRRMAFQGAVDAAFSLEDVLENDLVKRAYDVLPSDLYFQMGIAQARLNRLRGKLPNRALVYDPYDKSVFTPSGYDGEVEFLLGEIQLAVRDILEAVQQWQGNLRKIYEG